MQSEVLPSELQLVAPSTIPQARSYMFRQQSENTEYNIAKGERIRVNIPRLQRSYLMKDSYLRFRVNIDMTTVTSTSMTFDRCGVFGLFDRIEVYDYLGGTLLEQTHNIPALATILGDLNNDFMAFNGKLQATQGYDGSNVKASVLSEDQVEVRTANTGKIIYYNENGEGKQRFYTREFTIPVMSFLGLFSDKYIPLHNGFSVDFFLNSTENAFVSRDHNATQVKKYTINEAWISNFEYCCQVMELGEIAERMVMATNPFVIHSNQYRYFSDIILGGGAQSVFRMDLNLNVVSLRNIRFAMRPQVYQNDLSYPAYGHRIRNFLQTWNFQYGSSYLPEISGISTRSSVVPSSRRGYTLLSTPQDGYDSKDYYKADGYTQSYMELLKTVPPSKEIAISDTEYRIDRGSKTNNDYNADLTGQYAVVPFLNPNSVCGKFLAGLDTRLSKKNTISGIDTNGLLVCINGEFDRDHVSEMVQSTLDVWAEYDAFIQIIPGVATTVTF